MAERMQIQMTHSANLIELIGSHHLRRGFGASVEPCGAMPCSYQHQRNGFPLAFRLRMDDPAVDQKSQSSK
jgi:hypothetical protein